MGAMLEEYNKTITMGTGNNPLCVLASICTVDSGNYDGTYENDPTVGPSDGETNLLTRIISETFESIYKNLASLPSTDDWKTDDLIKKTFFLGDGKEIHVETDMRTQDIIITKLTGDTGYDTTLYKKVVMKRDNLDDDEVSGMDTTYYQD
jgi:hypothetical protein